jgi:predicted  nucleic acid-binding Zn-ribbon protein
MNPIAIKAIAGLLLAVALIGGYKTWEHHIFEQGVAQEKARRDKIDADNTIKAQDELAALNAKVRQAQSELASARDRLASLETELQHEKDTSADYQRRLAAGTERMRVLTIQRKAADTGPAAGTAPAAVDPGAEVVADLAPSAGAAIERLRLNENSAVIRLEACINAYDAVKAAADALNKP